MVIMVSIGTIISNMIINSQRSLNGKFIFANASVFSPHLLDNMSNISLCFS